MLRLVALLVYLQLIFASSPIAHSTANADSFRLKSQPAPTTDAGGGLDPWGSPQKPQPAPTTDSGGGYDPWG